MEIYDIVHVEPVGELSVEKLVEEIMTESRRNKNWLVSRNSSVKMLEMFNFPGMCETVIFLLLMFSHIKFSWRSTHRIFFVVVPFVHWMVHWLSFLISIGWSMGRWKSRKSSLNSKRSLVVSFILWTSVWHELCAVSLWYCQLFSLFLINFQSKHDCSTSTYIGNDS